MAQLLPIEENFFLLFRIDNPLESSVEFMKVDLNMKKDEISLRNCLKGSKYDRIAVIINVVN